MQIETPLDTYTIADCLLVTSYCRVHVCTSGKYGAKYRIKDIPKSQIPQEITTEQVETEIKIWRMIQPSIPKLIEVYESPDSYYIVTELYSSLSLHPITMLGNCILESRARNIFRKLVECVAHLHSKNIFLRNLRPEHILLDYHDNVAITDFSFAVISEPTTFLSDFHGEGIFSAPEMLDKRDYPGEPVDIWSLGVVLYCMLCPTQPWAGMNNGDLLFAMSMPLPRPASMSLSVFTMLEKMLSMEMSKRFSLSQVQKHYWLTAMESITNLSAQLKHRFGNIIQVRPKIEMNPEQGTGRSRCTGRLRKVTQRSQTRATKPTVKNPMLYCSTPLSELLSIGHERKCHSIASVTKPRPAGPVATDLVKKL